MNYQRNVIIGITSLLTLFVIGISGYMVLEGWDLFQATYMTVITLTTVGYQDYGISKPGQLFTIVLLIGGFGVFAYSISIATAFIIEGQLQEVFRRKKMETEISRLSGHYIICGIGDTGIHSLDELLQMNADFVAVEHDEERIKHCLELRDFLYVHGDATEDEVLIRAGIERARGVITTLSRDQDNLFVVLSSKQLNPHLRVVSKAVEDTSPSKLVRAGADDVVLADHIGGFRLVSLVTRPEVTDFLDSMLKNQVTTRFTESVIQRDSELVGLTLNEAQIPSRTGLVVVAIRAGEKEFVYNPSGDLTLQAKYALIVIAGNEQLERLHTLTGDSR